MSEEKKHDSRECIGAFCFPSGMKCFCEMSREELFSVIEYLHFDIERGRKSASDTINMLLGRDRN